MTACGDGQEESKSPITLFCASLMIPKSTLRVGCLNIRTLLQVGKEFRKYRLDILGLSKMRWSGFGKLRTSTGEYILYSGSEEDYQRGEGLVLKKEARMALLRWNPLSGRIMKARFNCRYAKLTIIMIYAPTNGAEERIAGELYEQLQKELEREHRHRGWMIMGNANASKSEREWIETCRIPCTE